MKNKTILNIIVILSILGFLTSLYLVKNHYYPPQAGSICDINSVISCSFANSSDYSEIFNVPSAVFGALWFLVLGIIAWRYRSRNDALYSVKLLIGTIVGVISVIYFVIAEIILQVLCPFCTIAHIFIIISFILTLVIYKREKPLTRGLELFKKLRSWLIGMTILFLIPIIILNVSGTNNDGKYDALAQCLTEKGVKLYSSYKCGVCLQTKEMLGSSIRYIDEVECHPNGPNSQTELCVEKNIEGTPTWVLEPNGTELDRHVGFLSIDGLKEFAGCK